MNESKRFPTVPYKNPYNAGFMNLLGFFVVLVNLAGFAKLFKLKTIFEFLFVLIGIIPYLGTITALHFYKIIL